MDLLEGCDLRHWMDDHRGQLLQTLPERLTVLRRICEALALAHTPIIHRDLKPANIFLQRGSIDAPLIMDFGLAVTSGQSGMAASGTPKYTSPERRRGSDSRGRFG